MKQKPLEHFDILLVEDNEMNTLLASAILQGTGACITGADNGVEAIEHLRKRSFDLILMDLHLPIMDGFETTSYIRNNISATIPIIAITANVVSGEEKRCMNAGMNGFISKPYSEKELLDKIAACVSFENEITQKSERSDTVASSQLYDLTFLKNVSRESEYIFQQMIQLFISQAQKSVSEIKLAYSNCDFDEIYAIAHRIKPDIDNLEIVSLKEDIRKIEMMAEQHQNGEVLKNLIDKLDDTLMRVVYELQKNVLSGFLPG